MLLNSRSANLAGASAIALGLFVLAVDPSGKAACAPVPKVEPIIKVRLALDKAEITLGETVKLEESIPVKPEVKVSGFTRTVTRIGRYDPQSGGTVNLRPKDFEDITGLCDDRDGALPAISGFSNPRMLPDLGKGRRGIVTEFVPKRLGIFLIQTRWSVSGDSDWHSPPIVLVVQPPTDEKGRPIVKPEWLAND